MTQPAFLTALADRVTSADDYRARQRQILKRQGLTVKPFVAKLSWALGIVREGDLVRVHCACGDWPSVYQPSQLACCCSCGAIYENVPLPEELP